MKTLILTLVMILGIGGLVAAQTTDTLSLKPGQQKTSPHARIKIKFISVLEDSRCPIGVDCIWAGNAKIKVQVSGLSGGPKMMELNTTTGRRGDQYDFWAINLESLTPIPRKGRTIRPKDYRAQFSIVRIQR